MAEITPETKYYPFPDQTEQWNEALQTAVEKLFITQPEMDQILEDGYVTEAFLKEVHSRLIAAVQRLEMMRIGLIFHWTRFIKPLDLSARMGGTFID